MKDKIKYVHIKTLAVSNFDDFLVARLRAAGIDVRLVNNSFSVIYPLDSLGAKLEVPENQVEEALALIAQIEEVELGPDPDEDFREADLADIEFERASQERKEIIDKAQPPTLIYLLIFVLIVCVLIYNALHF